MRFKYWVNLRDINVRQVMFWFNYDCCEMIVSHWCIMNSCFVFQNTSFDDVTVNSVRILLKKIGVDSDCSLIFAWKSNTRNIIQRNIVEKKLFSPFSRTSRIDVVVQVQVWKYKSIVYINILWIIFDHIQDISTK